VDLEQSLQLESRAVPVIIESASFWLVAFAQLVNEPHELASTKDDEQVGTDSDNDLLLGG
jgi:hypothetical protein